MSKLFSRNVCFAVVVAMLAVLGAAPAVMAQTDIGFDLRGGLTVPIGDLNESHNLGIGAQGSMYFAFSPVAAVGLGVGYAWFQYDDSDVPSGLEVSGGNFSTLSVCPELRFMVGAADMPTFTAIAGAGLYRLMQSDLEVDDLVNPEESETYDFDSVNKFGMNIAGRVVFPVTPMAKLGFEAMNHLIFTDDDSISFFEFMVVLNITTGP
jgi:hypothetical protein